MWAQEFVSTFLLSLECLWYFSAPWLFFLLTWAENQGCIYITVPHIAHSYAHIWSHILGQSGFKSSESLPYPWETSASLPQSSKFHCASIASSDTTTICTSRLLMGWGIEEWIMRKNKKKKEEERKEKKNKIFPLCYKTSFPLIKPERGFLR